MGYCDISSDRALDLYLVRRHKADKSIQSYIKQPFLMLECNSLIAIRVRLMDFVGALFDEGAAAIFAKLIGSFEGGLDGAGPDAGVSSTNANTSTIHSYHTLRPSV